jgi:hypothetical protein
MSLRKSAESRSCRAVRLQELVEILRNLQGLLNDYGPEWYTESLEMRLRAVLAAGNGDAVEASREIGETTASKSRIEGDSWILLPRSPQPGIH